VAAAAGRGQLAVPRKCQASSKQLLQLRNRQLKMGQQQCRKWRQQQGKLLQQLPQQMRQRVGWLLYFQMLCPSGLSVTCGT
jgi:hypothetical protein